MTLVTVGEHASLTTRHDVRPSLSLGCVSPPAFEHLCRLSERFQRNGARLLQFEGTRSLRLGSHVGVIQTPCGTTVEILPKHLDDDGPVAVKAGRALLRRLIRSMMDMTAREAGEAALETFTTPLSEWVASQFLAELDRVVRQGIRFQYRRVEEEQPTLRGQLDVMAQMRQPPGRAHLFRIRHDEFSPDRAENRLVRSAVDLVRDHSRSPDNWRLAHELGLRLAELPPSADFEADFRAWSDDRLMAHYQPLRPWCELLLRHAMPVALRGAARGLSLLFPMEKLFERHVAACLRRQLDPGCKLCTPAASRWLCQHGDGPVFRLEPDILVQRGDRQWILDAKWKLLDEAQRSDKYGLSQADFYQLYAYGQKYLDGAGQMALVYPRTSRLNMPLAPFRFSECLHLHVLPFDLATDELLGRERLGLPWRVVGGQGAQAARLA